MSLHKYRDLTIAANDAAAYTQCVQPHRKLIQLVYSYLTNKS